MVITLPNKTCDLIAWRADRSTYVRYNEVLHQRLDHPKYDRMRHFFEGTRLERGDVELPLQSGG